MARKPDLPCADCGKLMWSATSSLPVGLARCQPCRRLRPTQPQQRPCSRDGCDRQFSGPSSQRTCSLSCGQYLRFTEGPPTRSGRTYRQCEICGLDYVPTHTQQRTCGRACGGVLSSREYRELLPAPQKAPPAPRVRPCDSCKTLFVPRSNSSVTCGRDCYKALLRQRWAERPRPVVRRWCAAAGCGASFLSSGTRRRKYCTTECANRARPGDRRRYRDRARKAGVPYEKINNSAVFERDKWRCGICRRKVNPRLKYPDPMSASLDHVIPFAAGGGHLYANVQLAHLQCNVDKGAGSAGEQLALTG